MVRATRSYSEDIRATSETYREVRNEASTQTSSPTSKPTPPTGYKFLTQAQMDAMTLEELALTVLMYRYENKYADSKRDAEELEQINARLTRLSELYQKLVELDNKIDDAASADTVAGVLNSNEKFQGRDVKSADVINTLLVGASFEPDSRLFSTKASINIPGVRREDGTWTLPLVQECEGGLLPGTTKGFEINSAVKKLESKIQQLSTDNQFKSTRASTSIQATAGALEALKSLNDKFHNSLLRILGA